MKFATNLAIHHCMTGLFDWVVLRTFKTCMRAKAGLILLLGMLNISDGALTYYGLAYCDLVEANPVLDFFSPTLSLGYSILLVKIVILLPLLQIFLSRAIIQSCKSTLALMFGNLLYVWVVSNNANLILFTNL